MLSKLALAVSHKFCHALLFIHLQIFSKFCDFSLYVLQTCVEQIPHTWRFSSYPSFMAWWFNFVGVYRETCYIWFQSFQIHWDLFYGPEYGRLGTSSYYSMTVFIRLNPDLVNEWMTSLSSFVLIRYETQEVYTRFSLHNLCCS